MRRSSGLVSRIERIFDDTCATLSSGSRICVIDRNPQSCRLNCPSNSATLLRKKQAGHAFAHSGTFRTTKQQAGHALVPLIAFPEACSPFASTSCCVHKQDNGLAKAMTCGLFGGSELVVVVWRNNSTTSNNNNNNINIYFSFRHEILLLDLSK